MNIPDTLLQPFDTNQEDEVVPTAGLETANQGQVGPGGNETNPNEGVKGEGNQDTLQDPNAGRASETAGGLGIDRVLSDVEEQLGPEYAEAVRDLQRAMVQANQSTSTTNSLKDELTQQIAEVEQLKAELTTLAGPLSDSEDDGLGLTEEEQTIVDAIPEEQRNAFEIMLKRMGVAKKSDLDAQSSANLQVNANNEGVEAWGEEFGSYNVNGEFVLNPIAKRNMAPIADRVLHDGEITNSDLYVLAHKDEMIRSAYNKGIEFERGRVANVSKGNTDLVVNNTGGGFTATPLWNRDDPKNQNKSVKNAITEVMEKSRQMLQRA